jgi:hypothetical protein
MDLPSRKSKRSAGRREPWPGRLRHQACDFSWIVGWASLWFPGDLRAAGWLLETMDERYGADQSQNIPDTQWIEETTLAGDVLLCKDMAIAQNPLESQSRHSLLSAGNE